MGTRSLSLDEITIDLEVQQRANGVDQALIEEYAERITEGDEFPPVRVFDCRDGFLLSRGFHRYFAHKRTGVDKIKAEVIKGTRRDAIVDACGANAEHGARRTNADKRKAVATLNDLYPKRSPNWIAERAKVSRQTVANYRDEVAKFATCQSGGRSNSEPVEDTATDWIDETVEDKRETVTGKDGKQYPSRKSKLPPASPAYPTYDKFNRLIQAFISLVDGLREEYGDFSDIVTDDGWNPELTGIAINYLSESIKELNAMKEAFEHATNKV